MNERLPAIPLTAEAPTQVLTYGMVLSSLCEAAHTRWRIVSTRPANPHYVGKHFAEDGSR
jgi:hypothetical protein